MAQVLIIGFVWPEPRSSAAGTRMVQLIRTFQTSGHSITYASACAKTDNAINLKNIDVSQVDIELNNSSFDDFIKKLDPKIVIFDRFMIEEQFGWRVAEHCPDALRILDTEDLHCLRKGRHQALKENKTFDNKYLFNDMAKREIASILRSDLSLIISEAEIEILKTEFKIDDSLLHYLPFLLSEVSSKDRNELPKYEARDHFVTIGNFLHDPNHDSIVFLKEIIWPLIREKLPEAELHIYGSYMPHEVHKYHNESEGFLMKGFAEDVNDVMKSAKVCLAPLRFGAGLKGKLVDAMANGTPCVTTTIGAEGMFGNPEANGFVENDPQEFANKSVELFVNKGVWKKKQDRGFNIINTRFRRSEFESELIDKINNLILNIEHHRQGNFLGSLLHYHAMQSTKYMSRWIEEKNKLK